MCLFPRHIDKLLAGALAKDDENKNKVEDVTKKRLTQITNWISCEFQVQCLHKKSKEAKYAKEKKCTI